MSEFGDLEAAVVTALAGLEDGGSAVLALDNPTGMGAGSDLVGKGTVIRSNWPPRRHWKVFRPKPSD